MKRRDFLASTLAATVAAAARPFGFGRTPQAGAVRRATRGNNDANGPARFLHIVLGVPAGRDGRSTLGAKAP